MSLTGLTITKSKDYSPFLEKSVRFTMATVEPVADGAKNEGWTRLYVTINAKKETEQTMLLASLHNTKMPNQALDVLVTPMDKVKISCDGASPRVFLSGHWLEEDEDLESSDVDSSYDSDEAEMMRAAIADEDEDEDKDESEDEEDPRVTELEGEGSDSEFEDADDDDDDEDEDEEPVPEKGKGKTKTPEKKKTNAKAKPAAEEPKAKAKRKLEAEEAESTPKKDPKKSKNQTPAKSPAAGKRVVSGGVVLQDFEVGTGKKATKGKRVAVYYEGRLANGKVFDSSKTGKGFGFRLGAGEVIKGWDEGVANMQVGGKRRITIPPAFAYGKQGAPPDIPKNATLTFDVQLLSVK